MKLCNHLISKTDLKCSVSQFPICERMNMEIGTETAQFPEKEYINGIFLAVFIRGLSCPSRHQTSLTQNFVLS